MTQSNPKREFTKSLLKVEVPVCVLLAQKRMSIDQILKLVPGAMIQFDKACDSPLSVEIGEQPIALGETVKVGDKFGLRISEILQHDECLVPISRGTSR